MRLASPTMHGDERHWVDDAIETNWVSTVGPNMCRHSVLHSMEMPGSRYDIGDLESYKQVQASYRGITR